MSYFPPYIDETGIHMPTYEDRLEALLSAYRAIFGPEASLTPACPDYQLLSVFARALDDASSLTLSAFHQMNPQYASGAALDLLLPQYGLRRLPGETDAAARSRITTALSGNGRTLPENILAALRAVSGVRAAALYVNDSASTDEKGIPSHSLCAVVSGGSLQKLAEALFWKKPPGIGTFGTASRTVTDENGDSHTVYIYRPESNYITFTLDIQAYDGFDESLLPVIKQAIVDYVSPFPIGQALLVPSVYGVCYAAAGDKASTFAISDLTATAPSAGGTTRIRIPAPWNVKLDADASMIRINVT